MSKKNNPKKTTLPPKPPEARIVRHNKDFKPKNKTK